MTDAKSKDELLKEIEELHRLVNELEAQQNSPRPSEEALQDSKEGYRAILENIEDGYYETDLSGNYIYCNEAYSKILGFSKEELISRNYKEVWGQRSPSTFQIFNAVYRTGTPAQAVHRKVTKKDGSQREIESSISLVRNEQGRPIGFRGISRDITERRRVEENLNGLISLLEATLESTADGILVVDGAGKIVRYNRKFVELWGIPDSILETRDDNKALAFVLAQLKDPDGFLKKVVKLYAHPNEESFDTLEFKNGRVFERYSKPQRIDAVSIGRVWSFRDVTVRREAEETLKESEERNRMVIEGSKDGIALVREELHVYVNRSFVEIFGYDSPEEIIGRPISMMIHPEDREKVREINRNRQSGQPVPEKYEFKGIRKNGQPVYIEVSAKRIVYQGEAVSLVFMRDITERKLVEEQLRILSLVDDLTGLYNRRGFLTLAEQELKMAHRMRRGMFLLFADLDHLKEINDRYGHQEGDRSLMALANIMKETFRDPDIIARIGGDEFVVLALEGPSESSADNLRIRLNRNLEGLNGRRERPYPLSLSLGVVRYDPDQPTSVEDLIAEADKKMYSEKNERKHYNTNPNANKKEKA